MRALKLVTATLLAIGVAQAHADQTNLVQNISIRLIGVRQGAVTTNGNFVKGMLNVVQLDTRQVIDVLGAATSNSFSSSSRLVLVTPLNGNPALFQVRDGNLAVDVTPYLVYEQLSDSVSRMQGNLQTGKAVATVYSIQRLALQNSGGVVLSATFDVNGFARQTSRDWLPGDGVFIDASGTGDRDGLVILRGSIGIIGRMHEVVP